MKAPSIPTILLHAGVCAGALGGLTAASAATPAPPATALDSVRAAIESGTARFDLRYRLEHVDQDGFDEDADASTLRSRFTWTSGSLGFWDLGIEADYVSAIGPDDYNSTTNGRTGFPVVADPEGFDLNQAFLRYRTDALTATGGRQRILHGDQRFVGGVGWRQNEQTYDAVRLQARPLDGLTVDYGYVANVNRIFGPDDGVQPADWRSDSHLLDATFVLMPSVTLGAFAHLLDFDNDNGPPNSTATYGVSAAAVVGAVELAARYAHQTDYADNPLDYQADYLGLSARATLDRLTFDAGWELLGSDDGNAGFRTPLATLHKFQGWADQFLATPDDGIRDLYAGIGTKLGAFGLAATYHDFASDEGSTDYGSEIDASVTWLWRPDTTVQLKYADYDADEFAADSRKLWLTVQLVL